MGFGLVNLPFHRDIRNGVWFGVMIAPVYAQGTRGTDKNPLL